MASSTSAPSGISTEGIRQVTGSARAGHERESQARAAVSTISLRVVPIPREVFVVEHRHGAAAVAKHVDDLLKELVSRIERLPLFVLRIVAVLADDHHAVDRQLLRRRRSERSAIVG